MLWKVLCITAVESLSSSCALTRCSVRSATAASSASLVALVALSESCSSRRERRVDSVSTVASIRISATPARSIASRNVPVGFGFGALREQQPALFGHGLFEVGGDRCRRRAVLAWPTSAAMAAVSPAVRSLISSPLIAIWRSTSALVSSISCVSVGIVLDGFDQFLERRQDRVAGLAVFPGEFADRR